MRFNTLPEEDQKSLIDLFTFDISCLVFLSSFELNLVKDRAKAYVLYGSRINITESQLICLKEILAKLSVQKNLRGLRWKRGRRKETSKAPTETDTGA